MLSATTIDPSLEFLPRKATDILAGVLKAHLGVRERMTVDRWADTRRVLTEDTSDNPGPWRTRAAPYTRGPMRAMSDPGVREVCLCFASQTGKSEILVNKLGHIAEFDPAPTMVVLPNAEDAQDFNKDRVQPAIKESPRWRGLLAGAPGKKHRSLRAKQTIFGSCKFYYRGSNSQAKVRSKPCKHRIIDELDADEFQYTAVEDARQRAAAWPGGQLVIASIPSYIGQGIELELSRALEHRYHVPCPHCLNFLELRMSGLKWTGGAAKGNADQAAATAHFVCDHCKGELREHHKPWMLERGVWVPQGAAIERTSEFDLKTAADWTPTEGEEGLELMPGYQIYGVWTGKWPARVGFRLPAFYSPWVKWADIARSWCEHGGLPTAGWFNGVLAEGYQPDGDKADADQVIKHWVKFESGSEQAVRASRARGAYRLGECPPQVLAITAGIDLQQTHAYAEIRGWGPRCQESWLLWFDTIETPMSDKEKSRRNIMAAMSRVFQRPGLPPLPIMRFTIDSGQGYRTPECYALARASGGRCIPCKGRGGDNGGGGGGMGAPAIMVVLDKWPDGSPMPGGVTLLEVNTWYYKQQLLSRLSQRPPTLDPNASTAAPSSVKPDLSAASTWHWPDPSKDMHGNPVREAVVDYLDQLTSEWLIPVNPRAMQRGESAKRAWRKRPGRAHNHFLDACVYNTALAELLYPMLGVRGAPGSGTAPPRSKPRFGGAVREYAE
ncbi:MAG TPA: phage terminase large subunit family protein [Pseudomonadota bacterium]|nr:phage terminase large subunit family protein [Pseudomonadota bacterium]